MRAEELIRNSAQRTIDIEQRAITTLSERIDDDFIQACMAMLACEGRIVVLGIGKSGHIGRKIAATLASTGTPALFVHPTEASHGDIGMITEADMVLILSNSGKTEEIIALLPILKRKGIPLIVMTGETGSTLGKAATFVINASVNEEACPLGLAPTSSSTSALVLGDALAMALLEARGFTREDYAISHPGGSLGRRLLVKVEDLMHSGDEIPKVSADTPLSEALLVMTSKGFGLTTVIDHEGAVTGVFTDGDLRRSLDRGKDIQTTEIGEVMSRDYKQIKADALAAEAARVMQQSSIYVLLVENEAGQLQGILKMHDLLQASVI
ncbi:MAG: KpsF/GutQ family sugar-phosphate isomerase [Gammaproteobacteria bacterium]|nr:KpsF/GutQ family sugar-phosphate isomerase [Gammaproteobacteria bacterium]MCY4357275.1 KpsF/GutQ family sugar-phosphate isomerase [Gammaproteobacteria bacterium]